MWSRILFIVLALVALTNFVFASAEVIFWYPMSGDCPGSVDDPLTYDNCFNGTPIPDGTDVEVYKAGNPDILVGSFAMNSYDICWNGEPNQGYFMQQTPISLLEGDQVYAKVEYCNSYYQTSSFTLVSGFNVLALQQTDWICVISGFCAKGYLTLLSPGPPDWGYRLHWTHGPIFGFCLSDLCLSTTGFVSGDAAAEGWFPLGYDDNMCFDAMEEPLISGSIDTFWLSAPYCDPGVVTWNVWDSSGVIEGPSISSVDSLVISIQGGNVVLNWPDVASSYTIYGSSEPCVSGDSLDTVTDATWTDANTLGRPSRYFYYVTAVE